MIVNDKGEKKGQLFIVNELFEFYFKNYRKNIFFFFKKD